MNPNLTNSTSRVHGSAVYLGKPDQITWLSLPNSIEESRSRLRAPPVAIAAKPPPGAIAAKPPCVSAAWPPYVNSAQPHTIAPKPPYVNAAPPQHVTAAPPQHVTAAPPQHVNAASQLIVSAALAFTNSPQVPLNCSKSASQAQNIAASKNSTSSCVESNQQVLSREQACVVGPAFSLPDSHEGSHILKNMNVPLTTSNDSHNFDPVIVNMQTRSHDDFHFNSFSVSGRDESAQEPQICIGSVFSLADSHTEHLIGQHETKNEFDHIPIQNSASQQTLLEHPALPHFYQQNKAQKISSEKEHDTGLSQFHTTLSTKGNQYPALCSTLNSPVHLVLPLVSVNNIHQNTTSKTSVSLEVSSPKDDSQLLLGCAAQIPCFAEHQRSTSVATSIKDAQLPVSQNNGSEIARTEKKTTDVLGGEEIHDKSASLTKPQDSSSTSQMHPNASIQEPEIVYLDTEDLDDCMLVKIDLNMHHLSYGSKIHNSEVVIDDSDNDEDVTDDTNVSSGETSSGNYHEPKSNATSTVALGENDPCGSTGSVSMEVEQINTEASKTNSKQTAATYTMSSTGKTHVTSVMSTGTKTQELSDKIYPEDRCFTFNSPETGNPKFKVGIGQIYSEDSCSTFSAPEIENPESELMDLHVDDDAPLSTVDYVSLNALKPSQQDKHVLTPVIQSVFSSSSFPRSTSDIPVLKESYCNQFLKPSIQGQVIENMLQHSEIPPFSSNEDVRKGQVSQEIDSSKVAPIVPRHESHHLQLDSATEITNSKLSRKLSLKGKAMKCTTPVPRGKAMKSTTPRPKGTSAKSLAPLTQTSADSSVVCKLCCMVFSSRMELVTHTWNWHRTSQTEEYNLKCEECGKCFANNSLLQLHKKVKCTSSNITDVCPGTMQVSLDSILHSLIKQNRVNGAPDVSSSSATFRAGIEPQPNTAILSSGAAVDISNSTHVDVSSVLNSFPQRNEVGNYSTGAVTGAAIEKHPDFAAGEKPVSEEVIQEDIKPVITSTGEILHRSDVPDQVIAGRHPSVSDSHKCTTCQKIFSSSFQLSLHQKVSEGCTVARSACVRCFVCAKPFTSSIIRYLHVLNNPECKEKVDRYCKKCSYLFNTLAERQDHLRMFTACRIYEQNIVAHVQQNVKEPGNPLHSDFTSCEISQPDKNPALAQENKNSTQATYSSVPDDVSFQVSLPNSDVLQQHSPINPTSKSYSEKNKGGEAVKQKAYIKPKSNAACPACKKMFATSMMLILHFNESLECKMKICSPSIVGKKISSTQVTKKIFASEVAKQISASNVAEKIAASDIINVSKSFATPKSQGRTSKDNIWTIIKSSSAAVTAPENVFCDISSADRSLTCKMCGAEFISENELTRHNEQKCRKLKNTKAVPQLKNLRIVLSRVSVMCQVCHLPFADDIRLAEHLHLNQPCQKATPESINRVLELKKSHLDIDRLKREGKRKSCEIVTGISNVTSTISMASSQDGCIALTEQMPTVDSVINEKLAKDVVGDISSSSSAEKQYDQGNENDESKGHADDSDKDELLSSMSASDEGSDMEESGSSSEEGNTDYTCKQCCKTYTSKSLLIKHNKSHHQSAHSKRTHCKVCTRKFHDLTGLQAHLLQFKFCFIPLTRPLWEQKQGPQICSMCKKVLGSSKDLRKHCFKKMACRLRYVNMVLKNMKEKDHVGVVPAAEAEIPVLKTGKENCESESTNVVSSSVQDYCSPVHLSSSNVIIEDGISCTKIARIVLKPLIKCLNCREFFDDFQEHLLKKQSCLDFFGIHANKCPGPLSFCYQCKTHFNDVGSLQLHACKGFVDYTHVCQTCGLKFTSAHNLHAHYQQSLQCNKTNLSSPQKNNRDSRCTFVESSAKNQQSGMFALSSAARDVPSSSGEQFSHCLICDARFGTLRLLMEHSYQHVEETPISCDRCSITFVHYNQFVSHQAFHIRMDKEANSLVDGPQLSTFGASTSMDKNVKEHVGSTSMDKNVKEHVGSTNTVKITRAQNSETMTNIGSACIFCHQEFGSVEAKLAHLTNDHACLAIMRYIIENKLFIRDQGGTEPFDRRVTDSNRCEFCNQSFSDKFYHYLNSACFGRLETAIVKYKSSPRPAQHQEIDSAVSHTECKEGDTHVLMRHQGEQQLSGEASPSRDPTCSTIELPEEMCCLRCDLCFRTTMEAKKHQSLRGHRLLLPRSVMESADWPRLRCKVCHLKCVEKQSLFTHMVNRHSNRESVLFHELGLTSLCCSLCNKKVKTSRLELHFQRHKMKFVKEIKKTPLLSHGVGLCIVCNRKCSSRKDLLEHMQQHTHADIFTPQASKASPVKNRKCSVGSSPKHEEDQSPGSRVERVVSSNKAGSCKLCGKQVTHIKYHSMHFKLRHKEYDPQSWKNWFVPCVDLKQESSPTKTVTSSKQLRAAFKKYRCKLCRRAFSHHGNFENHFRRSHDDIDPERQEEFLEKFNVTELLKKNDDFEMQSSQYVKAILKSSGKPQFPQAVFSNKNIKSQPKKFSCNVCDKQFSKLRSFKVHFKHAHRNYNVANWEDVFNVMETARPDSTNTEAATSLKCRQSASETLKLEHASTDRKNKDGDSTAFDSDMQNDNLPSGSRKTALLQTLGSCKLCHKKFKNLSFFKFHLKKYHSKFAPEDQKNLFKAFIPSRLGEDFKNCDREDSSSFTSVKSQKQNVTSPRKPKAVSVSRFKLLLRKCCVCHVTFRDVSLYQEHLMTHLKPCGVKLEDIHSHLIPNMPGIAKDHIDIQLQIQDGTDKNVVVTDEQIDDGCLYPDSTSDVNSVQTRVLGNKPRSQCMPTPAVYSSCLELSVQDQLKSSAGDCGFTNTERPKTNQGDSLTESCVDFVVDSSHTGLSTATDKDDCVISESGLLDMFSDDENDDDVSNKDNRSEMAGPSCGEVVHTIVDTLFGDCLTDHSHGKSEAEAVSVTGNSSTEPQFNQISPDVTNTGLKRKAHKVDLDQEQCSDSKRHNLFQVFCKDQVTDSLHVSGSDSCEMKTAYEVDADEGRNLELQGLALSCETLQLRHSVCAEEQGINKPSHISENACELRELDEVQSIENQSCGKQLSAECKDDPVIDTPSDKDKEDWGKKTSEIDKDNAESSEFCESGLTDHSNEKSEAGDVSVTGNSSTEPQFNQISPDVTNTGLKRKAHEVGLDQEQCSDSKRHNLSQEMFYKDQVTNSLHIPPSDSCETKTAHEVEPDEGQNLELLGHAISCETSQLSDTSVAEQQAVSKPSHVSEIACEMREVDEVDSDEVQSIENQSCEISCGTQLSTVRTDDSVSCEDDLVIDKPTDKD